MRNKTYIKMKSFIGGNGVFYVIGFIIAFALKYYYSKADSDSLDWILAPTVWWVQVLCGIPFEKEQHVGYVNHEHRFVIAPVCAGINFMIIAFSSLVFSFIHRLNTVKSRTLWMLSSLGMVYLYTIMVNSLRIIPSIYLLQMDIYGGWITPERIHTVEGTGVYFASILLLYFIVDEAFGRFSPIAGRSRRSGKSLISTLYKYTLPVFIYFAVTLGIPLLNGAYANNRMIFMEYAVIITAVCSAVIIFILLCVSMRNIMRLCGSRKERQEHDSVLLLQRSE